ncbi:patatin-like phospholipase family protein [Cetobacterium sp.]|uniref:patatin-like phospholipase family protein n=2 Tax=Cetobacterium sp. TaxID=2071632 RepID=UPI002FC72ECF
MKILNKAILFVTIFTSVLATDDNRVNSSEDKIKAIEKQIQELEEKKQNLENLKQTFLKNSKISSSRPKVGLVLSGGGAKGAAHIGVLKVLEKYNIPIDYIVGTSAGSIIAAMYSVGYTPDEIEKVITDLQFYDLFRNSSDRDLEGILEKTTSNKYPIKISISKDLDLSLPMGVLTGEYIYLELKKIFARAENITDFKELPIPFRAMTTNLQTGQSVGIDSGDLALSTLKSMAIPTFLDPIREGDEYFVDGGVADNFPVLEAVKMGADVVIGIDIAADPIQINDNSNIISILNKLSSYKGDSNTQTQKEYPDILITPDVKKHNTLNFDNLDVLVKEGEIAAEELSYALDKLSDKNSFNAIQKKKNELKNISVDIENINIYGNDILTTKEVEELKPEKENLNISDLNLWAEKLYAKSYIDRVFYNVHNDTIDFTVRERRDSQLKAGISYISNYGAGLELVAEIPIFNKLNLSTKSYTVRTELSRYPKISVKDITQYNFLDYKLLVSADISYGFNPIFLYKNGDNVSTYVNNNFETSVSVGTTIFNNIITAYSLGFKNMDTDYSSGEKIENFSNFKKDGSYITNSFNLYFDTMNKALYATNGSNGLLQFFAQTDYKLGDSFEGYSLSGNTYYPVTEKLSINAGLSGGQIYDIKNTPLSELFVLGGLRNDPARRDYMFYGLPISSIYSDNFFIAKASAQYNLVGNLYLNFTYNMATYNYNSNFGTSKSIWEDKDHGYGIGIGWDTFLGPMDFVLSNNVMGDGALYQVHIGYIF